MKLNLYMFIIDLIWYFDAKKAEYAKMNDISIVFVVAIALHFDFRFLFFDSTFFSFADSCKWVCYNIKLNWHAFVHGDCCECCFMIFITHIVVNIALTLSPTVLACHKIMYSFCKLRWQESNLVKAEIKLQRQAIWQANQVI